MLDVNIEKILPVTGARDSLNKIIDDVENTDELYVITKNGKPSAIIVGVHHLEKLTGIDHKDLMPDEPDAAPKAEEAISTTPLADATNAAPIWPATPAPTEKADTVGAEISGGPDLTTPESTSSNPMIATNGAQASPISPVTPAVSSMAPATPAPSMPPMPGATVSTPPANDAVDDIFGPLDEETPAPMTNSAAPATPTSPFTPPPTTPSTPATPPPSTTPPAAPVPPATPGQM